MKTKNETTETPESVPEETPAAGFGGWPDHTPETPDETPETKTPETKET